VCDSERTRINNHSFDELWKDLWITPRYNKSYEISKIKFEEFKKGCNLGLHTRITAKEQEWGFPKGKKNKKENGAQCALREFAEETGMSSANIKLITTKPYTEIHKVSHRHYNDITYVCTYYLAESNDATLVMKKTIDSGDIIRNITLTNESIDVEWMTYDEACSKLDLKKSLILKKIKHLLETS
jgi:ADP-ribose pyrophosphatase YjhB (NUDIX family)